MKVDSTASEHEIYLCKQSSPLLLATGHLFLGGNPFT